MAQTPDVTPLGLNKWDENTSMTYEQFTEDNRITDEAIQKAYKAKNIKQTAIALPEGVDPNVDEALRSLNENKVNQDDFNEAVGTLSDSIASLADEIKPSPSKLFTYTGTSRLWEDATNYYLDLLSSGTLTPSKPAIVDVELVGGGAGSAGRNSVGAESGGGGSGYTSTHMSQNITLPVTVIIGSGGTPAPVGNGVTGGRGGTTSFGSLQALGGYGGTNATGGNHGSGGNGGSGGAPGYSGSATPTQGGTDGGNGSATTSLGATSGTGQGTTTRPFGDATKQPYAGGGAGSATGSIGGAIGGGNANQAGVANTGGGAGGNGSSISAPGLAGGSGIVIVRWAK